jgi:hypothetical protein
MIYSNKPDAQLGFTPLEESQLTRLVATVANHLDADLVMLLAYRAGVIDIQIVDRRPDLRQKGLALAESARELFGCDFASKEVEERAITPADFGPLPGTD